MAGKIAMRIKEFLAFFLAALLLSLPLTAGESAAREGVPGFFSKDRPKQFYIKAKDGWMLSLFRYPPKAAAKDKGVVLLCHGFNYNSNFWDLDDKHSLARYLRDNGYDVWTVNLRGSGDSSKPAMSGIRSISKFQILKLPRILMRTPFNIDKFNWTVDDHIHKDLPAIIEFVKVRTGKDKVTWIGHSMGGMAMYGYLETENMDAIKSFVAIGTAVNAELPANPILSIIASQRPVANATLLINTSVSSQLRNLTLGTLKLPWEELFYNKENMDEITALRMFHTAIDDTAPGVIAQYANMINNGEFTSVDKDFNYARNLYRVKTPILVVAGSEDKMCPVKVARYAYENVSSEDKEFVLFSKANGYSADYGHCDLILGRNSPGEVYKHILHWLERK